MKNEYKLFVLDNSNQTRRQNSISMAQKIGWKIVESDAEANITAVHLTNVENDIPLSNNEKYKDKLIVVYSGSPNPTKNEFDIKSGRVLYILRGIIDFIKKSEWNRINQLIVDGDDGKPRFSKVELEEELLSVVLTLSILCQGYLTAHFTSQHSIKDADDSVRKTLKKFGWTEQLVGMNQTNLIFLEKQKEETEKPEWWLDVFNVCDRKSKHEKKEAWDHYTTQLKNEWGSQLPAEIVSLLEQFKNNTISDTTIVANAYKIIKTRLDQLC